MIFDYRAFYFEFERRFHARLEFDIYAHNLTIYVVTARADFTRHEVCDLVTEALLDALRAPLRAPRRTRQHDLIDGPLPEHLDALENALLYHGEYVQEGTLTTIAGEMREFRIDCRQLEQLVISVRRAADVKLGKQLLAGELFMSIKLMQTRIYHTRGRAFPEWRIREMLWQLEHVEKCIEGNGQLRTKGRNVV